LGYPSFTADFYATSPCPVVSITADSPAQNILIRVGPKAGILHVERIVDAVTAKPLRYASIWLQRLDNHGSVLLEAKADNFVPATTKVLVKIVLDGYSDWWYPGVPDPDRAIPLELKPGETISAIVALQPLPR
jgi:hypothetical protein